MRTVAVICEYNPFHMGHKHHIDSIRRDLGKDTAVIAVIFLKSFINIAPNFDGFHVIIPQKAVWVQ